MYSIRGALSRPYRSHPRRPYPSRIWRRRRDLIDFLFCRFFHLLSGKFPANLGCPRSIQDHHGEALASNLISMPSPDSVEACYCQKTTTKYLAGEEDRRKPPLVINFEAFVWSTPVTPCRFVTSKRLPSILATTPIKTGRSPPPNSPGKTAKIPVI